MNYVSKRSDFLMYQSIDHLIKESVDFEWDFKNNVEIDHMNNTIKWIKSSFEKSENKEKWLRKILSKVSLIKKGKIRKKLLSVIIPIVIVGIGYSTTMKISSDVVSPKIEKEEISVIANKFNKDTDIKKEITKVVSKKSFDNFIDSVAERESSGRWDVSNRFGYMGLYQMGRMALKDVSQRTKDPELKNIHKKVTKDKFEDDPSIFPIELQTKAFKQLLKNNKRYLKKYYKYIGKEINGVTITESGILGGAHLVGNSSVKKYLKTNGKVDKADANGVKCSDYIKLFSNYNISI